MSEHMSPIEQERQHAEAHRTPEPKRPEAETAVAAGTPDAVKEAELSRRAAKEKLAQVRGRGVDWVRPTDLFAQGGGALSRRGIDFTTRMNQRNRAPIDKGARWVAERARRLPPLSAFGRRGAVEQGQRRSGVGMR